MTTQTRVLFAIFSGVLVINMLIVSCVHEPFEPMGLPSDTNSTPDTTGTDTTVQDTTHYCDPDSVVFSTDINPILIANCSYTGCHDAATKTAGVDLSDYDATISTGKIVAGDADNSDFYQSLIDTDTNARMPKGLPKLSDDDIALLKKWIDQGALNIVCTDTNDTAQVAIPSFANDVHPIIQTNCEINGCHAAGGQSPTLANYAQISDKAARVKARTQAKTMPPAGSTPLTQDELDKIKDWVDGGAPNN